MNTVTRRTFFDRMKGAALLETAVYEEVEADTTATTQAAAVVAIVAVSAALAATGAGIVAILLKIVSAFLGWLIWSLITYLIGDKLLGGTATWGELQRTIGFAQTPGIFSVLVVLPVVGGLIQFIIAVWILTCGIVAIRQALDFGTGKAILTAVLGFIAYVGLALVLSALAGPLLPTAT